MNKEKNNQNEYDNIQKNYRLIIRNIIGTEDVSEYIFPNIEKEIDKFINLLEDYDKMIITKRYGLDDGIPKTLDDLTHIITYKGEKCTRERVRMVCNEAIGNLRKIIHLNSESITLNKESFVYNEERITHKMLEMLNHSEEQDELIGSPNFKSKKKLFYLSLYDKLINQKLDESSHKSHK